MRTYFTHGSHLPAGDIQNRVIVSGIIVLLLALLLFLMGLVISAPHTTVISLAG